MGAHQPTGLTAILGSTTDRVLHRAEQDVLVVRPLEGGRAWTGIRHILAATDFSAASTEAARRAVRLAEQLSAELTLLHVIDHFPVDRSNDRIAPEDQDPAAFRDGMARRQLEALATEIAHPELQTRVAVSAGSARRAVAAYARQAAADLVVIGSHGHYGLETILGATADGVVRRSPCDVLVVRAPD
jgi:universal stress protein A